MHTTAVIVKQFVYVIQRASRLSLPRNRAQRTEQWEGDNDNGE